MTRTALPGPADSARPPHLQRRFDRDAHPVEFGRVLTLSDGVFAIALTLLVLDLALPAATAGADLAAALVGMRSKFGAFAVSVVVVGTFVYFHHRLFNMLQQVDGVLLSLNVPYLGLVVLIPFAQGVLSEHPTEPLAYALFAAVLGSVSAVEAVMLRHGHRRGLLRCPLDGRTARLEALRAGVPVAIFFASMPLAYLIGVWTVLVWWSIWPLDSLLSRLEHRPAAVAVAAPSQRPGLPGRVGYPGRWQVRRLSGLPRPTWRREPR